MLKYIANGNLCFKVYGYPDFEMAKIAAKKDIEASKKEEIKNDKLKE